MSCTTEGGGYDKENGGSGCPARRWRRRSRGIVMPLNNEDLQYADSGTYTVNAQKVYTNGHTSAWGRSSGTDMTARSTQSSRS